MIEIVLCTDENYARYCAVVIASSIKHCANAENLRFNIITNGLRDETIKNLECMVTNLGSNIKIINGTKELPTDIDLKRFGPTSVMRLSLDKYLPADCKKAIYLDCDLIVLSDISKLWEINLQNNIVGAVTDICSPDTYKNRSKIFGNYFNSGVLLIDLSLWKKDQIGIKTLKYIEDNHKDLKYFDQDALNNVMGDNWKSLDLSWNFQAASYTAHQKKYDYLSSRKTELKDSIYYPKIVHFIGGIKPWHPLCTHPLQDLFIHFSKFTPWPIDRSALTNKLAIKDKIRIMLKMPKIIIRRKQTKYMI